MSSACNAQQQYERYHGDGIDEYLQYVPLASTYVLKAAGVDAQSSWKRLLVNSATSFVINAGVTYALKHTIHSTRLTAPTTIRFRRATRRIAFCGAAILHKEFGKVSPWISVAGFTVATVTAVDRVRRNRHHWGDVVAGAAIGRAVCRSRLQAWRLITGEKKKNVDVAVMPNGFTLLVNL